MTVIGSEIQIRLIETLLPDKIYTDKYQTLLNNYIVARSNGRIYHCPESNCFGLVKLGNFKLF